MDTLFSPAAKLRGIGQKRAAAFQRLGIETVYDLLYHFPRSYLDYTSPVPIAEAEIGAVNVVRVQLVRKFPPQYIHKGMTIYKAIATDGQMDLTIVIYNNTYGFQALQIGSWYRMSGKVQGNRLRKELSAPHIIADHNPNLLVASYPLTNGLTAWTLSNAMKQAVDILQKSPLQDWMTPQQRQKHDLLPLQQALVQIHLPADSTQIEQARRRLVFDELLELQLGMMLRRVENHAQSAYAMAADTNLAPFFGALPFTMTDGQKKAIKEITQDLSNGLPMNRLLQGDVGSGKTAVAAAACYFTVQNGMQCALMAPTEILAVQHYRTLSQFLEPLGVKIALLTGSLRAKEKRQIYTELQDGSIQLVVGTHAIFQKDVIFQNLALVITDEQHRFGVAQRTQLADKGGCPHKLVMSATPIPRTLALMIYGDLDISILRELPKGRLPVRTFAVTGKLRTRAYRFILKELEQGHQGYIVCPMIDDRDESELQAVTSYAASIQAGAFAAYHVGLLHGKMKATEKDAVMESFRQKELDLLVCTTVIEVGVDVPNATIMLIENADRFGLSQLHQLRGRVGRGSTQSYCILMTDHVTEDCQKRMQIMSRTTDGFQIAEADLQLRGPGDFFGERQHGLPPLKIADLSQDTKLLQEVQEEAQEILREDPTLSQRKNSSLQVAVTRLFERIGENGAN